MPGAPSEKRYLIAVGVGDPGDRTLWQPLPSVRADLRRMRELFVDQLGYEDVTLATRPEAGGAGTLDRELRNLDLSAEEIRNGLLEFRQRTPPGACESLVFYFSGHGVTVGDKLHLCTRGYADKLAVSGLDPRTVALGLDGASRKIWIILDVCSAASGVQDLIDEAANAMKAAEAGLWFLASSGGRLPSFEGLFSTSLVAAARACPLPFEGFLAQLQLQMAASGRRQAPRHLTAGSKAIFDLLGDTPSAPAAALPAALSGASAQAKTKTKTLVAAGGAAALLLASWLLVASSASHEPPARPRPIENAQDAVPKGSASAQPAAAPVPAETKSADHDPAFGNLSATVFIERGGQLVAVSLAQPLHNREPFGIYVKAPESAYVGVVHVGPHGRLTGLYPNRRKPHEVLLEPNAAARVPPASEGDLKTDDETGIERFVVFVSGAPGAKLKPDEAVRQVREKLAWPASWASPQAAEDRATRGVSFVRGVYYESASARTRDHAVIGAVLLEVGHVAE